MWFEKLTGFKEEGADRVRANLAVDGETMTSRANGRVMACGHLETPTLAELHTKVSAVDTSPGTVRLSEIVADVQTLHARPEYAGSVFQVASQFNLLEMVDPAVSPDDGIDIYEGDHTQGPACAIACGAGTIYRNYFAEVNGRIGQSADNQIDCLRHVAKALGNRDDRLWTMRNGYALASEQGLQEISSRLASITEVERDELRQTLSIGIQRNTEVTIENAAHRVTQVYCSALPVAYSPLSAQQWSSFARLVLEASYEATVASAILNYAKTGNNKVFLTLLGGGAFGNDESWILSAIERALRKVSDVGLNVTIVSYGASKPRVRKLVEAW